MPTLGRPLWDDPNFVLGTILPSSPGTFDLGSADHPFRNMYLSGSVVNPGDDTVGGNLVFTAASAKIIPGATSLLFRNNADGATNLSISNAGAVVIRAGLTVTAGGVTLTAGNLTFGAASGKIIPGATSLLFRDTGDTTTNLTIAENGTVTARGQIVGQSGAAITGNVGVTSGSILIQSTGEGFYQKVGGANARGGTVVVNGTTPVVVNSTAMNADAVIVFSLKTVGGTVGAIPHVSTYVVGTSFTIVGTASDTSTYNWMMMNLQ